MTSKPDTHYDAVLWWSFATFYLVGALTVAAWVLEAPLRVTVAGLAATGMAYIGAWHAREIHSATRVVQIKTVPAGSDDDWEKGEA